MKMTIRESIKIELDTLPEESLYAVRDFLLFQKYRNILSTDDATYLNSIPGMADSITKGIETPASECIPLSRSLSNDDEKRREAFEGLMKLKKKLKRPVPADFDYKKEWLEYLDERYDCLD